MIPETAVEELKRLAELICCRNDIEKEISTITGRPASLGSLGEYIAARVFSVKMVKGGAHQSIDGFFADGPLASCSVNVKWYALREGILDLAPGFLPDYYLVFSGPIPGTTAALGLRNRPWKLAGAYLFDAAKLVDDLELRGLRVGLASSVRKELWDAAEIFPRPTSSLYPLTDQQFQLLSLFQ